MNKEVNLLVLLSFMFLFTAFNLSETTSWTKAKEKDGVTVYTRDVEGSELKEFKAYTTVNASLNEVLKVLTNFETYPKWMHNYSNTKLLKKINDDEYIYYAVMDAPWPVWDRDVVIHFKKQKTDYGYIVHVKNKNSYMDEKEDCVRMKHFEGTWQLHDQNGKTKVISQVHADPSGKIPTWLANNIMVDGPISTLSSMQKMVK
jgi:ribosome-associated toxin RatA of RatAB toxin-antitoxin module